MAELAQKAQVSLSICSPRHFEFLSAGYKLLRTKTHLSLGHKGISLPVTHQHAKKGAHSCSLHSCMRRKSWQLNATGRCEAAIPGTTHLENLFSFIKAKVNITKSFSNDTGTGPGLPGHEHFSDMSQRRIGTLGRRGAWLQHGISLRTMLLCEATTQGIGSGHETSL